jgi:hypothetical protein
VVLFAIKSRRQAFTEELCKIIAIFTIQYDDEIPLYIIYRKNVFASR